MATKKATKTAAKKSPAVKTAKTVKTAETAAKPPAKTAAKKSAPGKPAETAAKKLPPTHEEISRRAEQLWNERGRPEGSPHIDWHHAEQQLKH